jgi:hypothetical protein
VELDKAFQLILHLAVVAVINVLGAVTLLAETAQQVV